MQTPCYQYSLGKIRIKCPQCGQRTFKPYVDNDGEMLSPEVGRCNRQFSCTYHKNPREMCGRNTPIKPEMTEAEEFARLAQRYINH